MRVTLNLPDAEVLRKIENADALEVIAKVGDEIDRVALLNLEVCSVAIGAEIFFTKPPREN